MVEECEAYGHVDRGGHFLDLPVCWFWVWTARLVEMRWWRQVRWNGSNWEVMCRIQQNYGDQLYHGSLVATELQRWDSFYRQEASINMYLQYEYYHSRTPYTVATGRKTKMGVLILDSLQNL